MEVGRGGWSGRGGVEVGRGERGRVGRGKSGEVEVGRGEKRRVEVREG